MAGAVRSGPDQVVRKAGEMLPPDCELRIVSPSPFVSRGALKLAAAVDAHSPGLEGTVALDVGASTGGFTDLLLHRGAKRVYAVDVGYGQLHQRLRDDPRVVCLERTNARYLDDSIIPEPIDVLTIDVSFISVCKILPGCARLLKPDAWAFVLVKPQFEAGRREVGKGGVVRSQEIRERCVEDVCRFAEDALKWASVGVVPSPVKGPKGNQEYMLVFRTPVG